MDLLGIQIAHELQDLAAEHLPGYQNKLARFVSFVNAPGAPDRTVEFTEQNGRKVPVLMGTPSVPVQ